MYYADVKEFLLRDVLSRRNALSQNEIIALAIDKKTQGTLFFSDSDFDEQKFVSMIKRVLRGESQSNEGSIIKSRNRGRNAYKARPERGTRPERFVRKPITDTENTTYFGKAGEFAVLSELVAAGYNANTMAIDEGIDIVASKNNIFYYIQVKTRYFDSDHKISVSIPVKNFERVHNGNVVYIIVIREKIGKFLFFIFHQRDIDLWIAGNLIERTPANINIKIYWDNTLNEPYLYTDKEKQKIKQYLAGIEDKFEL